MSPPSSAPSPILLSPSSCSTSSSSSIQSGNTANSSGMIFVRRKPISKLSTPRSSGSKRRTMSSIGKVRTPNEKGNERFLQSADKRRRYMRRGSKTSCMLRGSFRVELPSLSLDDSNHSCASNSTWNSSSSTSVLSLAMSESQNGSKEFLCSPKFEKSMSMQEYRLRLQSQQAPPPPFASRSPPGSSRKNRKEATVCLLSSALALASIQDGKISECTTEGEIC